MGFSKQKLMAKVIDAQTKAQAEFETWADNIVNTVLVEKLAQWERMFAERQKCEPGSLESSDVRVLDSIP